MYDWSNSHVFMVGIGGCGMSGLARMLSARGAHVSGVDATASQTTRDLGERNIRVLIGPSDPDQSRIGYERLPDICDVVVVTAAVRPDHPLVLDAKRRNLQTHMYAQALGLLMAQCTGVAVAGTHGKSTTAAMLGCVLADAKLEPNVIVGAGVPQLERGCLAPISTKRDVLDGYCVPTSTGFRMGSSAVPSGPFRGRPGILVAEACEFNRSFLNLRPTVCSIANVEPDHLDVYGTIDALAETFSQLASLIPDADSGGYLLINHDNAHRQRVCARATCDIQTIGFNPDADWRVEYEPSIQRVVLSDRDHTVAAWTMLVPGSHNAMNSAIAAVLALRLGADSTTVSASLERFTGANRRTQMLGLRTLGRGPNAGSVKVWDDYGHHPTECETTLKAIRQFDNLDRTDGKLVCVFQPHQHSRTLHFLDAFAQSFSDADVVLVPEIYFVRDKDEDRLKVTGALLVDRLRANGVHAIHMHPFEAITSMLELICEPGDSLVVMGAGPIGDVAYKFLEAATTLASAQPTRHATQTTPKPSHTAPAGV